ncbi:MAG: TrkH family potassium uptake protein [Oscillibacter sp.]|nr:TrkH family potassium uptake protein [Oscillibacter sp.]
MNHRLVANILGYILLVEAGFLLFPMLVAVGYGEASWVAFLKTAILCSLLGLVVTRIPYNTKQMHARDGFAAVALSWLLLSAFGALPYVFSGAIPHYIDALFETASGLTTTGSTILTEVEHLPKGILFWRAQTQWMGGMGVLVLFLALIPKIGEGAVFLMRAESPGPIKSKLVPKVGTTAQILYGIYVGLTVAETILLRLAGMDWYDAVTHTFCTISTGGYSVKNASIAAYGSDLISWIVIVFMFLSGVNFTLLFFALRGKMKEALQSEELRLYTALAVGGTALICLNLYVREGMSLGQSITDSAFQVVSVMTTTGFATCNFDLWPTFSKTVLVLLMFTGACAGSTAGGIKSSRLLLLGKNMQRELKTILHPRQVHVISVDGQKVEERVVVSAGVFFFVYLLILLVGTLIVSWDEVTFVDAFTGTLTCLSNVGPGLGMVGPIGNFSAFSDVSKVVLTLSMLLGRLELMPILVLLFPSIWKRKV